MAGTFIGIAFDLALMAFLGVAIYYGVRLNRQIAIIKSGREELQTLISDFTQATGRAETALASLKSEVGSTLDQARQTAHKAGALCDDLEFLIKRGEKVADALEIGVKAGRGASTGGSDPQGVPVPKAGLKDSLKESLRKGVSRTAQDRADQDRYDPVRGVAEKGNGRALTVSPEDRLAGGERPAGGERSEAKKARAKSKSELLKALQDMR